MDRIDGTNPDHEDSEHRLPCELRARLNLLIVQILRVFDQHVLTDVEDKPH